MKRAALAVVLVTVLGVAAFAAGGWSAAPPSPTEKKLLKDVKVLQGQVKTLQTDVKKLKTQVNTAQLNAVAAIFVGACSTAITADALQGTWQVVDQLSAATQAGKTYFGSQTPVSDTIGSGTPACQTIGVTRSQTVPPNIVPHSTLLALLK